MATIRAAAALDASPLFELVRGFPTPTPTPPKPEQFSKALSLPDPSSGLLVAEHERRLVGYVSGYCHTTFYAGGPVASVDELLVVEPLRGTGIGRQLMDAFEQWARDRQCVLVSLATRGAAAFYERRGYTSEAATTRSTSPLIHRGERCPRDYPPIVGTRDSTRSCSRTTSSGCTRRSTRRCRPIGIGRRTARTAAPASSMTHCRSGGDRDERRRICFRNTVDCRRSWLFPRSTLACRVVCVPTGDAPRASRPSIIAVAMPLPSGTRLGPYEVITPLGAGGMGEVYKGRDTRLDRAVALKVLPAHIATHPELRQRLEREARAISSLNHPHICALYDVGRQDGVDYLVMEYVEGETLAARLAKGLLPFADAFRTGIEIADALDKAHSAGIVHRDLKPANIMLTKAGSKLLDFGIARMQAADAVEAATREAGLTGEGRVTGTPQYMAPEQIEGKLADARADLFAFGMVFYELLTGRKAFQAPTEGALVAAILEKTPPPPSTFQPKVPADLDWTVARCLAKDREERWQTARDLLAELQRIAGAAPGTETSARPRISRTVLPWAMAGGALAGLLALASLHFSESSPSPASVRFAIPAPAGQRFDASSGFVAISPDGQRLAFVATGTEGKRLLWVRTLEALTAQPLGGTDDASFPFWSPDGRALAFFAGGKLKRIDATGGDLRTIADAPEGMGGTWNRDGVIVFAPAKGDGPLFRVSAAGGAAAPATTVSGREIGHVAPQFLPDGRRFLYLVEGDGYLTLGTGSLDSKTGKHMIIDDWSKRLGRAGGGTIIRYATGYLLFVSDGALVAQKFDVDRLQFEGDAVTLAADFSTPEVTQFSGFAVSDAGVLAHRAVSVRHRLVWFDRHGKTQGAPFPILEQGEPSLSPDDTRVAFLRLDPKTKSDIWLWDVKRNSTTRLTFDAADDWLPLWSPDGTRIAFASQQRSGVPGICQLYLKPSDGAAGERLILETPGDTHPNGFFPDGKALLYDTRDPATKQDLWVLPLSARSKPIPFLRTTFNEGQGQVSPDGRWIAYTSDESGTWEVYAQPFPRTGGKWQISTTGGAEPRWSADGKELFFIGGNRKLMAAPVSMRGSGLETGAATPLFEMPILGPLAGRTAWQKYYAVTSDAQRFLVKAGTEESPSSPITVVLDWTAALGR